MTQWLVLAQAQAANSEGAMNAAVFIRAVVSSLVFTSIGLVMFAVAFLIMNKVAPFSIRKEIEDDQNTALGIVIGSVIIGIALIVSAAVHG